jgi:large subunit ribosomal protein L29
MPILRMRDLRDMSPGERERRLRELRTELLRLRTMVEAGGAVENPARIRELKRTVARILTVEKEEKTGAKKK